MMWEVGVNFGVGDCFNSVVDYLFKGPKSFLRMNETIYGENEVIWIILVLQVPLVLVIIWVMLHRAYMLFDRPEITQAEVRQQIGRRLCEWSPEELVPPSVLDPKVLLHPVVTGKAAKHFSPNGIEVLNFSTMNFLNFVGDTEMEKTAKNAIGRYGVGSCGPRGFYGTVDVHLQLEERLANFMGTEDAIVYAFGFSCVASAIPAYAKRGDIVYADDQVNFAIQKGLAASRSTVKYFQHGDVADLKKLLQEQARFDKRNPKKAKTTRTFVIIEGISVNTGCMANLQDYIELKHTYKFRLIVDESISFGTVGDGRGLTSFYDNIDVEDIDLIIGSLEYAVGSIGGFCCGSTYVIEHQRLAGLGYCFSASLPPLLAAAAILAIDKIDNDPKLCGDLEAICTYASLRLPVVGGFEVQGSSASPIKFLMLNSSPKRDLREDETLQMISEFCLKRGLAITSPAHLKDDCASKIGLGLRVCISRNHTRDDIEYLIKTLKEAVQEFLVPSSS